MSKPTCETCRHLRGWDCHRFPVPVRVGSDHDCGEYTPDAPVPKAVLGVPALPEGWEWDGASNQTGAFMTNARKCHCVVYDSGRLSAAGAPIGVVAIVMAAHCAKFGGGAT